MKVAQLSPGAGVGVYCENCLRDGSLVRALRISGCDVTVLPMYLPAMADVDAQRADVPIFFGGINVYLQQRWGIFRKTPRWLDSLFDGKGLLKWVSKFSQMANADVLGQTTISMLKGAHGKQVKELDRLIGWLDTDENRPDIVCLSNVLLAGVARGMRDRLGCKVVCMLQDEDGFVDSLGEPYREKAWGLLKDSVADIDAFVSVSDYYADVMTRRLEIPAGKMHTVHPGIEVEKYADNPAEDRSRAIGFLSQMSRVKGLDILADAFAILKARDQFKDLRLHIGGAISPEDKPYVDEVIEKLKAEGLWDDVTFMPDISIPDKVKLLNAIGILAIPQRTPNAFAINAIEATAAGAVVVAAKSDSMQELLAKTNSGVLYQPNTPEKLAETIAELLKDPQKLHNTAKEAKAAVAENFNIQTAAAKTMTVFQEVL